MGGCVPTSNPPEDDVERGLEWARRAAETDEYVDVHCWTFTPESFLETLRTLYRLGLTSFRVVEFAATLPNELEFFCAFERLPRSLTREDRVDVQLASLPPNGGAPHRLDDGTKAMVLSRREVRLVAAKRRAAMAARRLLAKVRRP